MRDVQAYGKSECFVVVAIEEDHLNLQLTPQPSGAKTVYAVDDPHRGAVNDYWRQQSTGLKQPPHVLGVFTARPRRETAG
jgi:hypothetical protein